MHPNNKQINGYDFQELTEEFPVLKPYLLVNEHGRDTLDFGDRFCVRLFNQALLKKYYGIEHWDITADNLCPTVPGRADYLHNVQDIIGVGEKRILDIGTGANVIYPLIGQSAFDWSFVGTDIDKKSIRHAQDILDSNNISPAKIALRVQESREHIFKGVVHANEQFDACICNPPFFESEEQALSWNKKKWKGDSGVQVGTLNELVCAGGEKAFISQMIMESVLFRNNIKLFTCLVSRKSSNAFVENACEQYGIKSLRFVEMKTGRKTSRMAIWE